MPKHNVRTQSTDAPKDAVASLIAKASRGTTKALPPPEALDALRKLCAYNDAETAPNKRVSTASAIDLLQTHYQWKGASRASLDTLCRRVLGRKSWGTP